MGKVSILTEEQKIVLREFAKDGFLTSNFYFTGGTALSEVYLKHRYSEDLDFFSFTDFDVKAITQRINNWSEKHNFTFEERFIDPTHIFFLKFKKKVQIKVDFAYYPYHHLRKPSLYETSILVDSELDIAVNKLLSIKQRSEVKDYVDLYYLFEKFTFWDLKEGVGIKFNVEIEPLTAAADFLAVEDFEFLPRMIKPLTLEKLKVYFRKEAKKLGSTAFK